MYIWLSESDIIFRAGGEKYKKKNKKWERIFVYYALVCENIFAINEKGGRKNNFHFQRLHNTISTIGVKNGRTLPISPVKFYTMHILYNKILFVYSKTVYIVCRKFRKSQNSINEHLQLKRSPSLRRCLIEREICLSARKFKRFIDSHSKIWKFSTTPLFRPFAESSRSGKKRAIDRVLKWLRESRLFGPFERGLLTGLRAGEKKAIQVGVLRSNRTAFHGLFIELRPRRNNKKKMKKIRLFSTDFLRIDF